ncbi:RING/U-box superfamily protein [Artemisia annua]|uniref:RING/U-box superfamily protein n=1 Tax=Artemisia annua TaxID=35608 RepID=A0A2U1PF35_ARTAN|nr:RING/U-box superfamily protein [Artemisia annua]
MEEQAQGSSSDVCPICLSQILQESYLDQCLCFHKFCYDCILRWAKVVASTYSTRQSSVKCPLCKTKSSLIIYEYDGVTFKQHPIYQKPENSIFFTKLHKYRLQCYYVEPGNSIGDINVSRYWKSYKYRQPNRWLYSWVSREIQALIQENDVDVIVHHIVGVIDSWRRNEPKAPKLSPESKQEEFKNIVADAAKRFLTGRTDRFVNELEIFLASELNIEAYDKVYVNHLGWNVPEISNEEDEEPEERNPLIPLLSFSDEELDETT